MPFHTLIRSLTIDQHAGFHKKIRRAETFTRTYPDGTRATYTVAPGSALPLALAALKLVKKPALARPHKRLFPGYAPGATSTADYVKAYFELNTRPFSEIAAYGNHLDHLALYAPLPDTPAALYQGVDSVETVEVDE